MYSYIKDNDQNNKTVKGIKRIVVTINSTLLFLLNTLIINDEMVYEMNHI